MGDRLEYGDEHKAAHAEPEHGLALPVGEVVVSRFSCKRCSAGHLSLERQRQDVGRDGHRYERGDKQLLDYTGSGDEALVPKHDGGDVANGRECASRVGRYDYERGVDEAVLAVGHELAQYHNHDDGRGHVVEYGREEECKEGDAPQKGALALGLHHVAHEVEAAVLVNDFNYCHGSHEEEQRRGGAAEVALDDGACGRRDAVGRQSGGKVAGVEHVESPTCHEHQQRHGRLVHLGKRLQGDAEVPDDEYHDDCKC